MTNKKNQDVIKEYHLFAGIGGGIYGGKLLGHRCVGAVEILPFARDVLSQRKLDGCMDAEMDIDSNIDITKMNGGDIKGTFDVLCGGFPCQAFSLAAHGRNIAEKNLWGHMLRVVNESSAPIVFAENVSVGAIGKAAHDLSNVGYKVKFIRLGCEELGADHRRNRFWLLAVKNDECGADTFKRLSNQLMQLPKINGYWWTRSLRSAGKVVEDKEIYRRRRLLGVGNAQSPFVAASAFRILVNRFLKKDDDCDENVMDSEVAQVFVRRKTWITKTFRETEDPLKKICGLVHTPTTMANYCYPSMLVQHAGCRNYVKVFCDTRPGTAQRPEPAEAEYLMGFPIGASSLLPLAKENYERWLRV